LETDSLVAHLKPELRVRVKTHMLGLGPLTSLGENPVSGAGNRERGALTPASELTKEAIRVRVRVRVRVSSELKKEEAIPT